MPAGFGYGAVGGAIRRTLAAGGRGLSGASAKYGAGSGWRHAIGSDLMRYGGGGLSRMSGMGNIGLSATLGGIGGGMYGAVSGDTSVMGGALKGASLGLGGLGAARLGARGFSRYGTARAFGAGRSEAAGIAVGSMGRMSSAFIGNSASRGYNTFRGMYGKIRG